MLSIGDYHLSCSMFKKILFTFVLLLVLGGVVGFFALKSGYESGALQKTIVKRTLPYNQYATATPFIDAALGMKRPRFYLLLFLNNTELRPGGGFIGSYAVVKVDKGKPEILKIEGTEILDNNAKGVGLTPPAPLAKYLKIKTWQFRDSNWSPDFPTDAEQALAMYRAEGGYMADSISAVIGITPTLFEELLKITGPVAAGGIEFNSSNFTETLEYEVEYGYEDRGLSFSERKKMLTDLAKAMIPKLLSASITHWSDFMNLLPSMVSKKQLIIYSTDPLEEAFLLAQGAGGEMKQATGDYLMWVDANLGALKTDVVIKRNLNYGLTSSPSGTVAVASMTFQNLGTTSWRTTKYLDYARVYVPKGSKLIKVNGSQEMIAEGDEGGNHWFGAFISVGPGKTGTLTFTYQLPSGVDRSLADNRYSLYVQKQAGTISSGLTLNLKFAKKLVKASVPEASDQFGDNVYFLKTDLGTDREFKLNF